MSEPIDFYFDFSSPYGYLMSAKIDDLAARFGRQVRWRPVLLGVVFQSSGSAPLTSQYAPKGSYSLTDFARSARFLGVPYRQPGRFPIPTQAAARAYYWLHGKDCSLARRFAHAAYRALFVEDRDISAPATVVEVARELGVDGEEIAAAIANPEIKERLRTEVETAIARGVFGSPFVFIDGEPFFGVDRLPQMERWLEAGGF